MKKKLVPLIVFAIVVVFFYQGLNLNKNLLPSELVGKSVPEFNVVSLEDPNKIISNKNLTGEVALLNIWASWCSSCRAEHSFLISLAEQNIVPIYGLNYKDSIDDAKDYLRHGNPYKFNIFDEAGTLGIDFGVYGTPETFIIDKEGIIRYKRVGTIDKEIWESEMLPLIKNLNNT